MDYLLDLLYVFMCKYSDRVLIKLRSSFILVFEYFIHHTPNCTIHHMTYIHTSYQYAPKTYALVSAGLLTMHANSHVQLKLLSHMHISIVPKSIYYIEKIDYIEHILILHTYIIHTHHSCIHIHMHVCTSMDDYKYVHKCVHTFTHIRMHTHIHAYIHIHR